MIEATPDGWWYSALVPSGDRVVAFLTDADLVDSSHRRSDGFRERLRVARHLHALLAGHGYAIVGRPRGGDAGSSRLDRFAGEGWVAAGDAAIAFDPLSSQGLLCALDTGTSAGRAIDRALAGDPAPLVAFSRRLGADLRGVPKRSGDPLRRGTALGGPAFLEPTAPYRVTEPRFRTVAPTPGDFVQPKGNAARFGEGVRDGKRDSSLNTTGPGAQSPAHSPSLQRSIHTNPTRERGQMPWTKALATHPSLGSVWISRSSPVVIREVKLQHLKSLNRSAILQRGAP